MIINDDKIIETYRIFRSSMRRYGKEISLPVKTDPRKTYSWRYLVNFLERAKGLDIDNDMLPHIIDAIVDNAKRHNQLKRGIAVLDQRNIVELCCVKLEREIQNEEQIINRIHESYKFLISKKNEENVDSLSLLLATRKNYNAYANIVSWHQAGYIAAGYIAVSKACNKAMQKLESHEIRVLPELRQLLRLRLKLLHGCGIRVQLQEFMSSDLIEE